MKSQWHMSQTASIILNPPHRATPLPETELPITRTSRLLQVTVILSRRAVHPVLVPEGLPWWAVPTLSPSPGTAGFAKMSKKQSVPSRHLHFATENKIHTKKMTLMKCFMSFTHCWLCHLPGICYKWATPSGELESFIQPQRVHLQTFSQLHIQWSHLGY